MEETIKAFIARDKSDVLTFFETKPIKSIDDEMWVCSDSDNITTLLGDLFKFPQVKWEDKEPTEVELTIKIK